MQCLVGVVVLLGQAQQLPVQRHVFADIVLDDPALFGLLNLDNFLVNASILT